MSSNRNSSSSGIGICGVLTIVFVVLKLVGVIIGLGYGYCVHYGLIFYLQLLYWWLSPLLTKEQAISIGRVGE